MGACYPYTQIIKSCAFIGAFVSATFSHAEPLQGQIQQGEGQINHNGLTTTIQQQSHRLDLSWQSFNLNQHETVNFVQPNQTSIAVNQILDNNGSRIQGQINANGQVWLLNPNGIVFGQHSRVNVAGLVASALDEHSTLNGVVTFGTTGAKLGAISNQGQINTTTGGYVAFIGQQVSNQGDISSSKGSVALGAGSKVKLSFSGSQLLDLNVEQSTLGNLADNQGLIHAEGGQVLMNAGARDSVLASVVNNDGVITANSVVEHDGKIILLAGMQAGTTQVSGSLDASAKIDTSATNNGSQAQGGFIETSGHKVNIAATSHITTYAANGHTGTWLIDPNDYTIAASDGDISGGQLSTNLGLNNVEIQSDNGSTGSNGNIAVNDAITWNTANTLTLTAKGNIYVNQVITSQHANGKVILNYGQANLAAGNNAQYNLSAPINLQAGNNFSTKLGSDGTVINYTVITTLGSAGSISGSDLQGINGNLAGYFALGANIDASSTSSWNGTDGFDPIGDNIIHFTGRIDGLGHTVDQLTINRPTENRIGLVGFADGAAINNIGVTGGSIIGFHATGGLVGRTDNGTSIRNSYATAEVTAVSTAGGGLVGRNEDSVISNSYATGSVTGGDDLGGLVGLNKITATIENSYATGSVNGQNRVGGLAGWNDNSTILNSYASGAVTATASAGGLLGRNVNGTITNSFWDTANTGQSASDGGIGKTTAELQQLATFASWDIDRDGGSDKIWRIYEGYTRPLLRSFLRPKNLASETVVYDGNPHSYTAPIGDSLITVASTRKVFTNAGNYNTSSLDLFSRQQGYDLSGVSLVITPRALQLNGSREYNGNNLINISALTATNLVAGDTLAGQFNLSGSDAGNYTITGVNLGNSNYQLAASGNEVTITPRLITLNGSREYNGSDIINLENLVIDNVVEGDTLAGQFNVSGSDVGTYPLAAITLGNSNYQLAASGSEISIVPRSLTVEGSRQYDGSGNFNVSNLNISNLVAGESLSGAITIPASDVGSYSAADMELAEGNSNYRLASGTLDITVRSIIVNGSREYDGSNRVDLSSLTVSNLIAGDTLGESLNIQGPNVGDYSLATLDVGNSNYHISDSSSVTITPRQIHLAASRVYDATNVFDVNILNINNVVPGEALSLFGDASSSSKNVGQQTLLTGQLRLSDNNYRLANSGHTATITPLVIDAQARALDKTFDNNLIAEIDSLSSNGVLSGDQVQFDFISALFEKTAGIDLTVEVSGIGLTGLDSGNYKLRHQQVNTSASIHPVQEQKLTAVVNTLNSSVNLTPAVEVVFVPKSQLLSNTEVEAQSSADDSELELNAELSKSIIPTTLVLKNDIPKTDNISCPRFAVVGQTHRKHRRYWAQQMGVGIDGDGVSLGTRCLNKKYSMTY